MSVLGNLILPPLVLSRLQSFLPGFVNSTKELEAKIAQDPTYRDKVNLENLENDTEDAEHDDDNEEERAHGGQYIEMDLGLGVCDLIPIEQELREEDIVMSKDGRSEGKKVSIEVLAGDDATVGAKRNVELEESVETPSSKKTRSSSR
jgi:hypothetical protein